MSDNNRVGKNKLHEPVIEKWIEVLGPSTAEELHNEVSKALDLEAANIDVKDYYEKMKEMDTLSEDDSERFHLKE